MSSEHSIIDLVSEGGGMKNDKPSFVERRQNFLELIDSDDEDLDQKPKALKRLPSVKPLPASLARKQSSVCQDDEKQVPERIQKDGLKRRHIQHHSETGSKKKKRLVKDEELEEVPIQFNPPVAAISPSSTENSNSNDDIQIVGSVGNNALADFPHAREHCVVHPFQVDPRKHCPNCYCYVCDDHASKCPVWAQHSLAIDSDPKWKQEREKAAAKKRQQGGNRANATGGNKSRFASAPLLFSNGWGGLNRHGPSAHDLLRGVTRIYPNEIVPPPPFATSLHHYQKQSLAFMYYVEQNEDIKSGWLCSEVGMGKSAVVIALVARNPMSVRKQPPPQSVIDRYYSGIFDEKKMKLKVTVILTSVSLMGQWQDECKKHAPHLEVFRYHPSSGYKLSISKLARADIIISSATFEWEDAIVMSFRFRRCVMDESHLLGTVSAKLHFANYIRANRRWCVTATPFSSSVCELSPQVSFLDLERKFSYREECLKRRMIRHIKSQQINGSNALTLPPSTTTIKELTMTESGRTKYERALKREDRQRLFGKLRRKREGVKVSYLDLMVYSHLAAPLFDPESSKIEAVKTDLLQFWETDSDMRAVVYTQFTNQHYLLVQAIESLGLKMYSFTGSTAARQRDQYIREFQSLDTKGPAVFVITIRAGSVGITLTAASHVFLMEPCIDPATEVQAAGRIHRLGQTKPVGVTKYVYGKSLESNITKMHHKLSTGEIRFDYKGVSPDALSILLKDL